jgi:type IV secretory pathway VirB2 component (pilin)
MPRKIVGGLAAVLAVALVVVTPMYPTWLTDHNFQPPPSSGSMYWMLTGPLACILLVLGLVLLVMWCFQGRSSEEPRTEVMKRPTAPN